MAATEGLHRKFEVKRVDPAAQSRHSSCWHFVLDLDHDPFALHAIEAYADACVDSNPRLAADLFKELGRQLKRKVA